MFRKREWSGNPRARRATCVRCRRSHSLPLSVVSACIYHCYKRRNTSKLQARRAPTTTHVPQGHNALTHPPDNAIPDLLLSSISMALVADTGPVGPPRTRLFRFGRSPVLSHDASASGLPQAIIISPFLRKIEEDHPVPPKVPINYSIALLEGQRKRVCTAYRHRLLLHLPGCGSLCSLATLFLRSLHLVTAFSVARRQSRLSETRCRDARGSPRPFMLVFSLP